MDNIFEQKQLIWEIPTHSKHVIRARKVLNEIIENNPEYINIVKLIVTYPTQKWCSKARKKLNLDRDALIRIITQKEETYFGIESIQKLEFQQKSLELTEIILKMLNDISLGKMTLSEKQILNRKMIECFNSIHGNQIEVSEHYFETYYKKTILKICELLSQRTNELINEIKNIENSLDTDIQFILHNTDVLVKLSHQLKFIENTEEINFYDTLRSINDCINELGSYPFDGSTLKSVIFGFANGETESTISKRLGCSRTLVRNRYAKAIKVLSILLWGVVTEL